MNTQPNHYATLDEGHVSGTMRRIETLIRKHAPLLYGLPEHKPERKTWTRTNPEMRAKVIAMLSKGMNAYQVGVRLGVSDRVVRYYRRYATGPILDGRKRESFATQDKFGRGATAHKRMRGYPTGGLLAASQAVPSH